MVTSIETRHGRRPALVAAGHQATVDAVAEVLLAGGNAWDAALAGGFAASIAEPALSSLGGGGFMTERSAAGAESVTDFFVAVPGLGATVAHDPADLVAVPVRFAGAVQDFHVGSASVAVPGNLAGFLRVHEIRGRLELGRIVAPAVHLARNGVVVDRWQAHVLSLLEPILARTPEGREIFFLDDRLRRAGELLTNPALAQFLEDIGSGARTGFRAAELGGQVTAADLEAYRVIDREPLRVGFKGSAVALNPAPSFGGRLVAHGLEQLRDAPALGSESDVDAALALGDALASLSEYRRHLGDGASRGTTHMGVVDDEGNMVSVTTSNGSCSGEFAGTLGVQLNNMMGESDLHPRGFGSSEPGARIGSMMAPGILDLPGRSVGLGSGGSERIRSVLIQLVCRLEAGRSLRDSVDAPRLHWDGATMQAEPGWSHAVLEALGRRWDLNQWEARDLYFGGAHLVSDDGEVAGDPRRGGVGRIVAGAA